MLERGLQSPNLFGSFRRRQLLPTQAQQEVPSLLPPQFAASLTPPPLPQEPAAGERRMSETPLETPSLPHQQLPSHDESDTTDQSVVYLQRGKDSGDTPETAAARRQRDILQRDHCRRQRGGEEVSTTPDLSQFKRPFRYDDTRDPDPLPSDQQTTVPGVSSRLFLPFDQDVAEDAFAQRVFSRRASNASSYRGSGRSDSVATRRSSSRTSSPTSLLSPKQVCFCCLACVEDRPLAFRDAVTDICQYCLDGPDAPPLDQQQICCLGFHSVERLPRKT